MIGGPYVSRGRALSLSKAVRAGDFVFLTGVVPRIGDEPMTTGSIEERSLCNLAVESDFSDPQCPRVVLISALPAASINARFYCFFGSGGGI